MLEQWASLEAELASLVGAVPDVRGVAACIVPEVVELDTERMQPCSSGEPALHEDGSSEQYYGATRLVVAEMAPARV